MAKSRSTWIVPILVAIVAVMIYAAWHFKIEEAASTHKVALIWNDGAITSVRCARFTNEPEAKHVLENGFTDAYGEFPSEFDDLQSGDSIRITELIGGFNDSRILHAFVVAEIKMLDDKTERKLVEITPDVLKAGEIRLEAQQDSNSE